MCQMEYLDINTLRNELHPLACVDIFEAGREKMIAINISAARLRQKQRKKRAEEYMRCVYDNICNASIDIDENIRRVVTKNNTCIGSYRSQYRRLVWHNK